MNLILQFILRILSQAVLAKYKPTIIGVTGSVGKTSTKDAIYLVLKSKFKVRKSQGNLNNPLGVPLTVLGDFYDEYLNTLAVSFWPKVILYGLKILFTKVEYPEILVLELGADHPGDIESFCRFLKPKVGVVTAIGDIPVHVEFYSGPKHLASEKARLVQSLPSSGLAVLNTDDELVLAMKDKTKARVLTYGFSDAADFNISNFDIIYSHTIMVEGLLVSTFKLSYQEKFLPIRINALGESQAYVAAAAVAVGVYFGLNLVQIAENLSGYQSLPGRLKLIPGIKGSMVLDDTYNASPASMHLALDVLKELKAQRKIAVLGDMLELGKYVEEAHRTAGNQAAESADMLFCLGPRAGFIFDSAQNQMDSENLWKFDDQNELAEKLKEIIKEGDLVLVKGSQSMRMERIVESIMAEPEKAQKFLVRQGKNWKKK